MALLFSSLQSSHLKGLISPLGPASAVSNGYISTNRNKVIEQLKLKTTAIELGRKRIENFIARL